MTSLENINDPTEAMNAALILFAKAFQLTTPTKNNQRTSSNPRNRQISQPGMNMSRDRQSQNIGGNGGNQFGQYAGQVAQNQQGYNAWKNGGIQVAQNAVQNLGVQNGGNQNGLVVVPGIANQNRTGNIVAARAKGAGSENQTQLLIAQKEEAGIQLQAEEFDFMASAGTVRFGNDHIAAILGYGDLKWGNITITRVFFVEGLGHNLFSVGQFCDVDLEVAFRRNSCFIRDIDGVDLLKGNHSTNLYTINLYDMVSASPICLMARATPTKLWLWHQRLSHLNFDTINDLSKNDLVSGLPKFKYAKEHLSPLVSKEKAKEPLTHPNLFRIQTSGFIYFIWICVVQCELQALMDETPEVTKNFLKNIFVRLQSPVIIVRTDNGTEFTNHALKEYFDSVGITHETSAAKPPHQNGVVEHRNRTLVEAARTMLIFSHASLFIWAEAIATAKPDISYLHVFRALCYSKNDREHIGKLGAKGNIGFFIGYSANSVAYKVYNRRTKKIMETMNVTFDELSAMAFEQNSSKPSLQSLTSGQISFGLELTYAPSTITPQRPSERNLDILFEPLHNEYLGGQPSEAPRTIPAAPVIQNLQAPSASMSIQDYAPTAINSSNTLNSSHNVDAQSQQHAQQQGNLTPLPTASAADNVSNAVFEGDAFVNPFPTPSTESVVSSTQYVDPSNMHTFYQLYPYDCQWTKDHSLEQVIGEPSRPVLTRNQLKTDGDMCIYALTVSIIEPKTIKEALTDPALIESMQEELHQFIRLDVWELVLSPDGIKPLTLKWLFKNKNDDENTVIPNKTHLVVYVDDIISGSTNPRYATLFSDLMKSRFEMSMMGKMTFFLGLQ
nr:putative ribonuclease H-like domain-containing protein [Tanacetum cinerariifolium]